MTYCLGFIGAGNMAEAIARGVIRSGLLRADQLIASDVAPQRRQLFEQDLKVHAVESNLDVARESSTIMLCVKPQYMQTALENLGSSLNPNTLIISIAAGISSAFIEKQLGGSHRWRIVRSMPNTPMLVGEGMAALSRGRWATPRDSEFARKLFQTAATVIEVSEDKLDAVTALSGSGPAYFFCLVEQMIRAAVELGFDEAQARLLAVKTAMGASKMLASSSDSPQELRRKVTSPGGTTQAAISHMEEKNCADIIVQAIKAAQQRSRELGGGKLHNP